MSAVYIIDNLTEGTFHLSGRPDRSVHKRSVPINLRDKFVRTIFQSDYFLKILQHHLFKMVH